ncbi:MAG: DUF3140 domain-containing protein [Nocardioides sp.]|uniref:DUF3140 domain-containing protein n=1 Tax=Nocardioides sp. TaxID=35761 RepID=UPI003F12BEE3
MPTHDHEHPSVEAFFRVVTVLPDALETWLSTPESSSVGQRQPGADHSTGQLAGLRTLELLTLPVARWTESDVAHAARTVGFVRRHRAQWPAGDLTRRRWRYALRNWGHDPLWEERMVLQQADQGRQVIVVDGQPAGHLTVDEGLAGSRVEDLRLEEHVRHRCLAAAVLHRLALTSRTATEIHLTGPQLRWEPALGRRGFVPVNAEADSTTMVLPAF